MLNHCKNSLRFHLVLLFIISTTACARPTDEAEPEVQGFQVQWTDEFTMPDLLDQAPQIEAQEDLHRLLEFPWYASIGVRSPVSGQRWVIDSCNDYFGVKAAELRAQKEQEHNALLEFMAMCEATRLLSNAAAAERSYLPEHPLDGELPSQLPKSLALVTSQSEAARIANDPGVSTWGDINTIEKVDPKSAHSVSYHSDAGTQVLSVLGRGDFNADGAEDLLVRVNDTVEGGDYFNLRLFVLTVTRDGGWEVEAEY